MTEWLIPCNPAYYNVDGAFAKLKKLNWKQTSPKMEVGDSVYIYVSNPVRVVRFKCKVGKVNLNARVIDDSEFILNGDSYEVFQRQMELELLRTYSDEFTAEIFAQNGVKGRIQRPRRIQPELEAYLTEHQL